MTGWVMEIYVTSYTFQYNIFGTYINSFNSEVNLLNTEIKIVHDEMVVHIQNIDA